MKTQWHPPFVALMKASLGDHYEVEPEVPTSELPRQADLVLIRREGVSSPFTGIWMHLTAWTLFEFKGPTDAADDWDLDLLVHVGTGVAYRLNEKRREAGAERFANPNFALWYVAPSLGEAFWQKARPRLPWQPEGGGLWSGKTWGHPIFLLDYGGLDLRQEDSVPLALLRPDLGVPAAIRDVLLARRDLLRRFGPFLPRYQPRLWEALVAMTPESDIIDWAEVARVTTPDIDKFVPHFPVDQVIQAIGTEKVVKTIGEEKIIETFGEEELFRKLLKKLPPEKRDALIKEQQDG